MVLFGVSPLDYAAQGADKFTIEVLTLADRHRKIVVRGGHSPRYLATSSAAGHLVYVNEATLFAIAFDPDKLETHGTAVPILDDVASESDRGGQFDSSPAPSGHGTLVYRKARRGASEMMTLQWADPSGKKEPLRAKPGFYQSLSLSPDGKRIALTVTAGTSRDVWVYDQQRDTMTRLTFDGGPYSDPRWSPDGQHIVFSSHAGIFQARADGASQRQALTQSKAIQNPGSFMPDGKRLAYFDSNGTGIWTVSLEDQGGQLKADKPEPFVKSGFYPKFSPDGRWLAYMSNESGRSEVYVQAFPPTPSGQGGKWQISDSGGGPPIWSKNRQEIVYYRADGLWSVSYTVKGDTFVPEKPRVWIKIVNWAGFDLAPDGKRVLVLTPVESAEPPSQEHEVVFLLNFFDEVRRRAPAGR